MLLQPMFPLLLTQHRKPLVVPAGLLVLPVRVRAPRRGPGFRSMLLRLARPPLLQTPPHRPRLPPPLILRARAPPPPRRPTVSIPAALLQPAAAAAAAAATTTTTTTTYQPGTRARARAADATVEAEPPRPSVAVGRQLASVNREALLAILRRRARGAISSQGNLLRRDELGISLCRVEDPRKGEERCR